jgi:3-methyladenine DNA glycosylase AlkD
MPTKSSTQRAKPVKAAKRAMAAKPANGAALTKASKPVKAVKPAAARMSLAEVMSALEKAGSAQTRKTYGRHGVVQPMFGVSFATLKALYKRIGVDHELGIALWSTGNFDARNLAYKLIDPAQMSPAELDRWARAPGARMCAGYVACIVTESGHGRAKADAWLVSPSAKLREAAWQLVSALAMRDETTPDAWFADRVASIEAGIEAASNLERYAMNSALISIGCRSAALRKAATAAAKRIGKVEVDHGDTSCKTPDAKEYIDKAWTHSTSKGFESPAAQERARESMRLRC